MQCFILAAGLGTRLKPLTDNIPKALIPIADIPLLERQIKQLAAQGVTRFVVNVHHFADKVEDFLRQHHNFGCDIAISDERELLLDTGGALKKASVLFDKTQPVLIHNVDIISEVNLQQVYRRHQQEKAFATLVVNERTSSRYFLFNEQHRLCGWENVKTGEKKLPVNTTETLTPLAFGGIHVVSPEIFPHLTSFPDKFSIVDAYLSFAAKEKILAYNVGAQPLSDVGKIEDYRKIVAHAVKIS